MRYPEFLIIIIFFFVTSQCSSLDEESEKPDNPERKTTNGIIKGYFLRSGDYEAEIYEGIPFADPPIGSLRFKSTSPAKSWNHVLNCGKGRSRSCIEFHSDHKSEKQQVSEDCLYLDIILPKNNDSNSKESNSLLPILVWIEGLSFQSYGKKRYLLSTVVETFVPHKVIFVRINYRLGPLGFLSAGHHELQGNFGLDDQIEALKWIKANAEYIKGDKNRIVLGGENAGAASSSILSVSPKANGLFSAAMLFSGSILSPWAVRSAVTENNSARFIDYLGCAYNHTLGMPHTLKCLQSLSIDKLVKGWLHIVRTSVFPEIYLMNHEHFTPVIDLYRIENSVIPSEPVSLLKNNAHIPVLIAVTDSVPLPNLAKYVYHGNHLNQVGELDFSKVISPHTYVNFKQIQKAVEYNYLGDYSRNIEADEQKDLLMRIALDQMYNAPAAKEAMIYSNKNISVYAFILKRSPAYENDEHCNTTLLSNSQRSKRNNKSEVNSTDHLSDKIIEFINRSPNGSRLVKYTNLRRIGTKVNRRNQHEIVDFYTKITTFWYDTVSIIEMLDLEPQYRVIMQPCTMCDYPYKVPFYIMLTIFVFISVGSLTIFLHRQRVRLKTCYSMNGEVKKAGDEVENL